MLFRIMEKEIKVLKVDPFSEDAGQLIDELTSEIARRYDFQMDGKGAFSPGEVTVDKAGFYLVYLAEEPVACGALRPLHGNEIAEVKRMYVKPGFRGRGLAKLVLETVEQAASDFGYKKIWLETGDRQPEAINLYESAGYRRIENYGIYKENLHSNCFEKMIR